MPTKEEYKQKYAKEFEEGKFRVFKPLTSRVAHEAFEEAEAEHEAKKTPFEQKNPFMPKNPVGKAAYLRTLEKMKGMNSPRAPHEPVDVGDVWSRPRKISAPKEPSLAQTYIDFFKSPIGLGALAAGMVVAFMSGKRSAEAMIPPDPQSFSPSSDYAKFVAGKNLLGDKKPGDALVKIALQGQAGFGIYSLDAKNSGKPYPVSWFSAVDGSLVNTYTVNP